MLYEGFYFIDTMEVLERKTGYYTGDVARMRAKGRGKCIIYINVSVKERLEERKRMRLRTSKCKSPSPREIAREIYLDLFYSRVLNARQTLRVLWYDPFARAIAVLGKIFVDNDTTDPTFPIYPSNPFFLLPPIFPPTSFPMIFPRHCS